MNDNESQTEISLSNAKVALEKAFDALIMKDCKYDDEDEKSFLQNMMIDKIVFIYLLYEKNSKTQFKPVLYYLIYDMYQNYKQCSLNLSKQNDSKLRIMMLTWLFILIDNKEVSSIQSNLKHLLKIVKENDAFLKDYMFKMPFLYLIKSEMHDILIKAKVSNDLIDYFQENCVKTNSKRKYPTKNEKENNQSFVSIKKPKQSNTTNSNKLPSSDTLNDTINTPFTMGLCFEANKEDIKSKDDQVSESLPEVTNDNDKKKYLGGINGRFPKPQITNQVVIKKKKDNKTKLIEILFDKCKSSESLLPNTQPIKKEGDRTKLRKMITGGFYSKEKLISDIDSKEIPSNDLKNDNKSQDVSINYDLLNAKKNNKKNNPPKKKSKQNTSKDDSDIILAFKTPKRIEEQNISGANINQNNVRFNYLQLLNQKANN